MKSNLTSPLSSLTSLFQRKFIPFFLLLVVMIFSTSEAPATTGFNGKCSDIFAKNSAEIKNNAPLDILIKEASEHDNIALISISLISQVDIEQGGSPNLGDERLAALKDYFEKNSDKQLKVEGYANTIPVPGGSSEASMALYPDKLSLSSHVKGQTPVTTTSKAEE
jgi:hypothetical protein